MRRPAILLALGAVVSSLAACEFDEVTVPTGSSRPVVHAVLNPHGTYDFYVFVERTLGGRVDVREGDFDRDDPIVSGGGDPISGARVVISNPDNGDTGTGIEVVDERDDGKGRGVYHFINEGCSAFSCPVNGVILRRGMQYDLRIETSVDGVITGHTQIPLGYPRPDTGFRSSFNADGGTYSFTWRPNESGLRRYAVQIQTPYGPFQTFSSVESLAVNSTLRNFQQDRFPRVFVPGFRQALQALAVDENYFNYYRSRNDPFTGLGLVSSLTGATGVFGAVQAIRFQELDVVADLDEPVEGRWVLVGDPSGFPPRLTTYVDGEMASGRIEDPFDPDLRTLRAMLGTRQGSTLRLAVFNSFALARDTAWTFVGEVRGDTLHTTSTLKGEQKWRRLPP